MKKREQIARSYFDAFHAGRVDEVLGYFAPDATVQYGTEAARDAEGFFTETREMIAGLEFTTHGYYSCDDTRNVLIHFSYVAPAEDGGRVDTEAVDLIAFDARDRIESVTVIPRA